MQTFRNDSFCPANLTIQQTGPGTHSGMRVRGLEVAHGKVMLYACVLVHAPRILRQSMCTKSHGMRTEGLWQCNVTSTELPPVGISSIDSCR